MTNEELETARNRRRIANMDATIDAWRKTVADTIRSLRLHEKAKERFLQSLIPTETYYDHATEHPRLF